MCIVTKLTATAKGTMTGIRTRMVDFIFKQDARDFVLRVAIRMVRIARADKHVLVKRASLYGELQIPCCFLVNPRLPSHPHNNTTTRSVWGQQGRIYVPRFSIFASSMTFPHILIA
jgi:hypothetical protein